MKWNATAVAAQGVRRITAVLLLAGIVAGCGVELERRKLTVDKEEEKTGTEQTSVKTPELLALVSAAFQHNAPIPSKYTADGANISPPLSWIPPPEGTKALALLCDDPDAPSGEWSHWVLYDIPASVMGLPEGVPGTETVMETARQGRNDFGLTGYAGPAPPRGKPHRYRFTLYALDAPTGLPGRVTKRHVLRAIEGHVLATAELIGTYER